MKDALKRGVKRLRRTYVRQDGEVARLAHDCELRHTLLEIERSSDGFLNMEQIINVHLEKLPEGVYLATSDEVPGLVAQGRTVTEALEIARDVVTKLLEAQGRTPLQETGDSFDYPLGY